MLHKLQLASPPDDGGIAAANVGAHSTGLVSYPNMLRALGLSRYVGDRLRRERRFRIVASGRALFVPSVDVERLRVFLGEQDAAKAARDELAELHWFTRALEHRQPIALGRQTLRIAVCGSHLSQRVVERVVDVCEITWVAGLALRIRLARSGEVCADCAHKVPIRDPSPHIIGGVDVSGMVGDKSRGTCVAHFCDALAQAANEVVTGSAGKYISVRGVVELFEQLYVGNAYDFCSVCMTDAGEAPIRKRVSSPAHHYDFISRHPTRAATPTLRALP